MQDRYCDCGCAIKVQFIPRNLTWAPKYWILANYSGGTVETCPVCGKPLDINRLR